MAEIHSRMEACQILGLSVNASDDDIKHAYKELSKRYHPDAQPDERLHWQYYDIVAAYQYLTNQVVMQQPVYAATPRANRVLGADAHANTWASQRKGSDEAYAKWEKKQKQRKREKDALLEEKQKEIRRQREYENAMKQIDAIRTARAIEALLDRARDKDKS